MTYGLILDWGGVLTTPMQDSFDDWMGREGVDPASFQTAMRRMHDEEGSPLHRVERGLIDKASFESSLASELRGTDGSDVGPEDLVGRMMKAVRPNPQVRRIAAECRAQGWRVIVLSNSWGQEYDMDDIGEFADQIFLSDRIGLRKPDPMAYRYAVACAGLEEGACLMVDDLRRNVRGARSAGLAGFHYRPGTEAELQEVVSSWTQGTTTHPAESGIR